MPKNTPSRIIDNRQARAVSFLGGGGTAGGTTDHGTLSGLADDDHLQYLRTDGTRTLTGNLAVSASVTIDGIDISAHAADANAHHNQAHVITGSDHTVTGSTYQIVGLTGTNTIGLLTPSASPGANAIVKTDSSSAVTLVDLTVSSDLFMTGTLDFGTNTIAEDATYLQFAGSKALRFAQNLGNANWTLYNAGGYTTTGSISITGAAGDLTVGSNVLFVDNSGNNVGIACVPDSQFALDVAGPARAQYFIGPHAIQLKDATMILHYDGAAPYNTNYNGVLLGHKGQTATMAGGYTFRPGKFGKALQIAPATTNLVAYPSVESGTVGSTPTGWTMDGTGTFVKSADVAYYGTYSGKLTVSSQQGYPNAPVVGGVNLANAYTVSAWVWIDTVTTGTLSLSLQRTDTSGILATVNADMSKRKQWQRITATYAGGSSTTKSARVLFGTSASATFVAYIDGVQCEQVAYATPYCDGSLNPVGSTAHAWTGTAHASTSTRTAATMSYAASGNIDATKGTIMAWVNTFAGTGTPQEVLRVTSGSAHIYLRLDSTNKPQACAGTTSVLAGSAITAGAWTHLAMTWDGANVYLYVNGVYAISGASSGFGSPGTPIYVGCYGASEYFNGLIDDIVILDRTMTINADNSCDEIRAVYESNAPVFAESSTVSWVATPGGLVWADAEGLWMKDTAANPVFGIYGGDSTKSWGGFTLATGDLLIGNNAVGSSAILWDESAGTFGFYGAGSATAQATVATDGSITAGAGALALNSSGIQISAPSSQSSVGSYKFLVSGKTITSGLSAYYNSGADTYYCGVWSNSSNIGSIVTGFDATIGGGGTVKILFGLTNSLSSTSTVYTLTGSTSTWWFGSGNTTYVGIGTAAAPTRAFQVAGGLFAGGEETGLTGYTQFTNATNTTQGSGTGIIKMTSISNRNNDGFIKIYIGTTAYWLPYWGTIN